jgi:PUA domain protein
MRKHTLSTFVINPPDYIYQKEKITFVNRSSGRSKWFCDDYLYTLDPFLLPHQQVDKGAIKFILSGANIMCPGLTSPGAKLIEADKNAIIVSFYS